jgi:pimeloyl-ACP methyl ester carboxylesterase
VLTAPVLHVEQQGAGPVLLVLPSFRFDCGAMAAVVEPALGPDAAWTRIYVDLPGTGGSAPTAPSSDAVLDAVLDAVVDSVGTRSFAVTGWSYGGFLAAGLVRRLPGQAVGLQMVCSGVRIRPQDRDLSGVLPSSPEPGWLDAVPPHLRDHLTAAVGMQTAEVGARVAGVLGLIGPAEDAYLDRLQREGFALDDQDAPTPLDGPVSLVAGRRDRLAGYRAAVAALDAFPQAELAVAAEAGHYLPVEDPAFFAAATQRWLRRCTPLVTAC